MNFTEADALTRIFPYLVRVVLPRGAVDLARKLPISDTALVATTNVLMARKEVHPAIVDLLAVAISQAHGMPGLFHKVGEFPTETDPEYPISQGARDFYKSGPSFLNRYLPFWMTSYAQRVVAVLVAVTAIVVPVFNYAPKLFLWLITNACVDYIVVSGSLITRCCRDLTLLRFRRFTASWKVSRGRQTSFRCEVLNSFLT